MVQYFKHSGQTGGCTLPFLISGLSLYVPGDGNNVGAQLGHLPASQPHPQSGNIDPRLSGCREHPSVKTYKGLRAKKQAIGGSYYENRFFHLLLPSQSPPPFSYFSKKMKVHYSKWMEPHFKSWQGPPEGGDKATRICRHLGLFMD